MIYTYNWGCVYLDSHAVLYVRLFQLIDYSPSHRKTLTIGGERDTQLRVLATRACCPFRDEIDSHGMHMTGTLREAATELTDEAARST
jgi:hypothetical protein